MDLVKIIPLGGCGEIGKNCTVLEQGDDLIVIDCGLSFPHEEQLGVDIVLPDFSYLVENQDRIKGVFLTHAHEDHVGGLPYLLNELPNVPVYCTDFTAAMCRSKIEERSSAKEANFRRVKIGDTVTVGSLTVEFILVTHSIPDTCALAIKTNHGIVLFTADFKLDFTPVDKRPTDLKRLAELGEEGVVLLLSDSTNVERPGWGPSESVVAHGLQSVFAEAEGRILITMFSSSIHRMQQAVDAAALTGRKVSVAGRRMDAVVSLAQSLDYLKIPDKLYVPIDEVSKYPNNELVIFVTGSQGEPMAALSQMSRQEYTRLKVKKGDTILYSARPIPGNEGGIWRTVNRLVRLGANVIIDHPTPIHVSGHAYQDELKMMVNLTKPFYIAPVHGEPRHQKAFKEMLHDMGHADHRIFELANGDALCMDEEKGWIGEGVEAREIFLDQSGSLEVTPGILRERMTLGHDGVVVVTLPVDPKTGEALARPQLHAKGFCGTQEHLDDALDQLVDALGRYAPGQLSNVGQATHFVEDTIRRALFRACRQRPMVIGVLAGMS
jgi:ribonuclease J